MSACAKLTEEAWLSVKPPTKPKYKRFSEILCAPLINRSGCKAPADRVAAAAPVFSDGNRPLVMVIGRIRSATELLGEPEI